MFFQKSFIFILVLSGIISLIGFSFSLYFFTTLISLKNPRIDERDLDNLAESNYDAVQVKCIFNRSYWIRNDLTVRNSSQMEFVVHKHMPKHSDCESFLFNIANYSLMQCIILLMAAFVSLTILVKTLVHESFINYSRTKKLACCCQTTDQREKCKKIDAKHGGRSVTTDEVIYNAKAEAESPSSFSFSSSFAQRTDSFDSDVTKYSFSTNNCVNRCRFRYYSNTESELPGVIIESSDDIANDIDDDDDDDADDDEEFTTC